MRRNGLIKGLILISIALVVVLSYVGIEVGNNKVHRGVKYRGVSLYGLTKDEAREVITKVSQENKIKSKFNIKLDNQVYEVYYDELGYNFDANKASEESFSIGRGENKFVDVFEILSSLVVGKNIDIDESFNDVDVNRKLDELAQKIFIAPVDADINYLDGNFSLTQEADGRYLNYDKLKELLKEKIKVGGDIDMPIIVSHPKIKKDYFDSINGLLAEFETSYTKSERNRKDNIILGASKINGSLVKPDEIFSFNDTVGDITLDTGFKVSGVILNGEFDTGVGGGICQVSTTLYNAVIRADIEVVERINHSRPISYVELGTDAAVVSNYKDLKFKNNTGSNIYIKAFADDDNIKFQIFGDKTKRDYEVKIVPKLLETISPKEIIKENDNLPKGESEIEKKGANGYSYETYKEIIKNGEVVEEKRISRSYYIPQDKVIVIGTKEKDKEVENKSSNKETKKEKHKENKNTTKKEINNKNNDNNTNSKKHNKKKDGKN